jgi:hypothetical protein
MDQTLHPPPLQEWVWFTSTPIQPADADSESDLQTSHKEQAENGVKGDQPGHFLKHTFSHSAL